MMTDEPPTNDARKSKYHRISNHVNSKEKYRMKEENTNKETLLRPKAGYDQHTNSTN